MATMLAETSVAAVVSLLFFFTLFIAILIWVYVAGKSGRWARDARIPLDDDRPVTPRTPHGSTASHGGRQGEQS